MPIYKKESGEDEPVLVHATKNSPPAPAKTAQKKKAAKKPTKTSKVNDTKEGE